MKKRVKIDYLSRVEGEGGIFIEIRDREISRLNLRIFEAPRFFESLIKGRPYSDVADFTARICGICPAAYQMSSVHAIEQIFGVKVERPIRSLRRLLYAGEWIESHALHVYLLQGPDFYGIESAWASRDYLPTAKKGLSIRELGNRIMRVLGGRPIHPVSVKVGGFYRIPGKKELTALLPDIERAYEQSLNEIRWAAGLAFSGRSLDTEYVSLRHEHEYPMNEGRVVSSKGLDMTMTEFTENLHEYQVEYSTALHSGIKRNLSLSRYLVGPVARVNLNFDILPSEIKDAAAESGVSIPIRNVQSGIIARAIEIAYACSESIRIIREYEGTDRPPVKYTVRPGEATWITEAPRGMLIHKYTLDEEGFVKSCAIIPPTSQNLSHIEKDLSLFLQDNIERPADFLRKETEKIIRGYDPCISCSVHMVVKEGHRG